MSIKFLVTPLEDIIQATINLYGDIDCDIDFVYGLPDEGKYGKTIKTGDGYVVIQLAIESSFDTVCGTLAHELAHVVVGVEHGHDKCWEECFKAIREEYDKYCGKKYNTD